MFEIHVKYKHIDIYVEFDENFVPLASFGSGKGSPKGFFSGYARGSAPVTEKGTDIGENSFVSASGGGYASARGGGYAITISGEFASARGGGVASRKGESSDARGGGVTSARGGGSASARGGSASASCGGFSRAMFDDDDFVFIVNSFDEEYMFNSEKMARNYSSGNDDENYEDENWQDKDDGYISDYKSDDNCGAYSSDDDKQTRMANKFLKGNIFEWKEGENIELEKGMLFDDVYQFRSTLKDFSIQQGFKLRAEPDMKLDGMHIEVLEKSRVKMSRMQLCRAKRKALEKLEGSYAKSYAKIPIYVYEVRKTNLGNLVKLELERIHPNPELPTFKRFFYFMCSTGQGV
ncbi:hypothetical protein F0562_022150 [Nyssa sinensis]|uniref:Transposase MuDR plant domain-containing protein n=1 Tax=Nyssa sinensis TaxID=561372 RepID=A0A5J5BNK4_9ASTE|nr:hypothetical protein F0562_022150 [Nyssa sinensis]